MKLDEIEKLCIPNSMENRHGNCFPIEIARKLLAVAKAAKFLRENTDECGDSLFEHRHAVDIALEDLEK